MEDELADHCREFWLFALVSASSVNSGMRELFLDRERLVEWQCRVEVREKSGYRFMKVNDPFVHVRTTTRKQEREDVEGIAGRRVGDGSDETGCRVLILASRIPILGQHET